MKVYGDTWNRRDTDFPSTGTQEDQIRFLIGYATLAPSGHNTQPWLFSTGPNWVDVIADRTRALPVVDPYDRELTISCGAAIGMFEVAARRFGLQATTTLCPDPENVDHLVRIAIAEGATPSLKEIALFDAIQSRRTDRSPYLLENLSDDLVSSCRKIVQDNGADIVFIEEDNAIETIAHLVAEGDELQFDDPHFRRELAAWVHSFRFGSRDGMSGTGFGMSDVLAPAARFVIRTFDLGNQVAAADQKKILAGSPALALIWSNSDTVEDWIQTGRGLAKLLLKTTSAGFAASYLNQPIEVTALRPKLAEAAECAGYPQVLLRVGRSAHSPDPTARRQVAHVVLT